MSEQKTVIRKEETHCLLVSISEYESNFFDNRNTNAKKWPYILDRYNRLIRHSKRCKQSRTLRVRYQKLVSMYSSGNMTHIRKFCNDEDIELLKQMIIISSEKNNTYTNEGSTDIADMAAEKEMNHIVDDEYSANEDEQPLDTIKVLPRSSYLSTRKNQIAASSTDTASLSNNSIKSYNSQQRYDMNNGGKKLSILYGAALMEDDVSMTSSDISRDLEIIQMKETIKNLQNTVTRLEDFFTVLSKRLDDMEKS